MYFMNEYLAPGVFTGGFRCGFFRVNHFPSATSDEDFPCTGKKTFDNPLADNRRMCNRGAASGDACKKA